MIRTRDGLIPYTRRRRAGFLLVVLLLALTSGFPTAATAQLDNQYPRAEYFMGLGALYEGDYRSARQAFQSALRSGRQIGAFRWVDSICYLAMLGECHYQAGEPAVALDFYTQAIEVHLNSPAWLLACNFPPSLTQSTVRVPAPTWGPKGRPTIPANFPEKAMIGQGRLDNDRVFQEGGVAMAPQFLTINANEVARCLAQAIRRRSEILGPNAVHDPLTSRLIGRLSLRAAPANHWSQKWTECWLGLAYVAANRPTEAVASLQSSLAAGGQFDHPLTAIALVELGKLAFQHRHYDEAALAFYEATFPAAFFQQMDVLEEAFRLGSINHLARGASGAYAPLGPAQIWARQQRAVQLQVSVMVEAAEHLLQGGEPAAAMTMLDQSRRMTGRRAMGTGIIGTRLQFLTAVAHYQAGNIDAGTTALAPAITRQQQSSLWLFQMGLADRLVASGSVTERVADEMYSYFLREPEPIDWAVNPQDALAVWSMPNDALYERWFEIAVRRNEEEKALEISERWRRRQFLLSQPLGGRLLSLRWLMEAPTTTLSEQAVLQRKVLLGKYPLYGELHRQVALMRDELKRDTLVPDDPEDLKVMTRKLADIAKASAAQERLLWRMAVGRDLTDWAFPRAMDVRAIRQAMPEGQVILSFFTARGVLFVFQLSRDDYRVWRVPAVGKIRGMVASTLRQMGNLDGKYAVAAKDLADESWKVSARELYQMLMNQKPEDPVSLPMENCQELVIIPQGPLWYFPFEAVPITKEGSENEDVEPLLAQTRVRYLPMLSFAMPDFRGIPILAETIAMPGKLTAKEEDGTSAAALEQLATLLPHVKSYTPQKIPSRYLAPFSERLLVYSAIDVSGRRGPLGWNPLPGDRANMDGTVAAWMALPWGAPAQLILPGFSTPAESSLKRGGGTGDELFLASCGLLAAGSRTVLLSRWRVGGKSTYGLINEFAQELPHLAPPNAWQRAVQLTRVAELDPTSEPRVNRSTFSEATTLDHPFFWAGYLLIDQSQLAPGEAPPPPIAPDMLADGVPPLDGEMRLDGEMPVDGALEPGMVLEEADEAEVAEVMEAAEEDAPRPPGLEDPLEADLFDPLAE